MKENIFALFATKRSKDKTICKYTQIYLCDCNMNMFYKGFWSLDFGDFGYVDTSMKLPGTSFFFQCHSLCSTNEWLPPLFGYIELTMSCLPLLKIDELVLPSVIRILLSTMKVNE